MENHIKLRKYQNSGRYQVNRLLNAGRHPVLCMPTGTGKTITATAICLDRISLGQRVFVLTPQEEIFQQWRAVFAVLGIDAGYINSDGVQGRGKMIYVCMPLSLNNILSLLPERFKPDIIVTDECHHSEANTWQNIYNFYTEASRLGLTATPERTDGKGLENTYTDIIQTINTPEAVSSGFLAEPLIVVPEEYHIDVPVNNGDYDVQEQAEKLGEPRIIGNVIEQYSNIFAGLPVLVACSTYEHAKKMTESFREIGWKFDHIHSNLSMHDRRRMLRQIRNGKLNGLCTVGIGIEGMDIPGLYGLIWLRRTLSVTIYLQFTGRVLRPMSGKKYGIIIDPVGNTFIHGRPEIERQWSLRGRDDLEKKESFGPQMKICPNCGVMNAKINIKCHICGFDFTEENIKNASPRKLPAMVDGNLIILDAEKYENRKEEIKEALKKQRAEKNIDEKKEPVKIESKEKMEILKNGLEKKGGLFAKIAREYL